MNDNEEYDVADVNDGAGGGFEAADNDACIQELLINLTVYECIYLSIYISIRGVVSNFTNM